jgi:hypothetical protein
MNIPHTTTIAILHYISVYRTLKGSNLNSPECQLRVSYPQAETRHDGSYSVLRFSLARKCFYPIMHFFLFVAIFTFYFFY